MSEAPGNGGNPRLAVVYDGGSVSPLEIGLAADGRCDIVLVIDPASPSVTASLPVLERVGTIVPLTPGASPDDTVRRLADLGVRAITTFTDARLPITAELAARLGLRFHSPAVARRLTDKLRQRERLAAAGLPTVRFAELSCADDIEAALTAVGVPAVLKPRQGAGSRSTFPAHTAREFRQVATDLFAAGERQLIAEERLTGDATVAGARWGDYVSVESVVNGDRITHVGITGKAPLVEPFRESGVFFPSTLGADTADQVLTATRRTLRALEVTCGVTHTEFKLTANGPRLIEVNGRLGGFINDLVGRATGVSMLRLALENALGMEPPVPARVDRPAGKIAFQRFYPPPVWAGTVAAVTGVKHARAIPGVARVEIVRQPGAPVDWRQGTLGFAAIVYGAAADHTALHETIATLDDTLRIDYRR
jgi:biotin carboxylase